MKEIEIIHTGQLDMNNDEIILYYDANEHNINDDGYCAFDLTILNRKIDPESQILIEYGCHLNDQETIIYSIDPDAKTYDQNDINQITNCYIALQK